jgi:hypothetical protein
MNSSMLLRLQLIQFCLFLLVTKMTSIHKKLTSVLVLTDVIKVNHMSSQLLEKPSNRSYQTQILIKSMLQSKVLLTSIRVLEELYLDGITRM